MWSTSQALPRPEGECGGRGVSPRSEDSLEPQCVTQNSTPEPSLHLSSPTPGVSSSLDPRPVPASLPLTSGSGLQPPAMTHLCPAPAPD